ncbi:MAG TPA: GTP-binding protein [Pseudolabrys sp.]|nr:GTP-binding protein [Pseudolabrys sp.]
MNQLFQSPAASPFGRRVKRERGARIPVTVVTGFLGAGKTTLLQKFLQTDEGRGTALVVNEFGAAGIDDALLRSSADETVLLGNGCLCCVTRSDLQIALRRLVMERECGEVPDFRRVVIETSGLADPSPILQTFVTDRALGGEFHVETVVTVVDAAAGEATLGWSAEARKQAILADTLIVTKTDLVSETETASLIEKLRQLNPRASIDKAVKGALDPRRLTEAATGARNAFAAEAEHSDGISSFVITETTPIKWPAFARAIDTLQALRGPDLLRAKGILNVEGCRGPVVVQMVQHLSHPPIELEAWPDADRTNRIVFITRNVPETQVRDLFAAVKALAP